MSLLHLPAPDFKLFDQHNHEQSLTQYHGRFILLYFYPKDDTPGCTVEACSFRDRLNELNEYGVQVLGVSVDDIKSHQKFTNKYHLNFPLLADTDKAVVHAYGVWQEKSMYGKKYLGTMRESFLIDKNGVVVRHYEKVKPETHIDEVLLDLNKIN